MTTTLRSARLGGMEAASAPPNDEPLLAALRDRSAIRAAQRAFEALYARHARPLLAFLAARLNAADVDDVHQTLWSRVWDRPPERLADGRLRPWLFQVARNLLADRGRRRTAARLDGLPEPPDPRGGDPAGPLLAAERAERLQHCLDRLAPNAAAIVRARLDGEGYDELCPRLALTAPQAHKLFHTARTFLEGCVQQTDP